MPEKSALVILAEGAEEMEAVIVIDILRRAGVKVTVAGLRGDELASPVKCCRGTVIVPDIALPSIISETYDAVILPGGQPGSDNLARSEEVGEMLLKQYETKRIIGAICAAPLALKAHDIPADLITCHPCIKKNLEDEGYRCSEDRVVISGNIITSQAPGTAFEFALKLVEQLVGFEKAQSLIAPMVMCCPKK